MKRREILKAAQSAPEKQGLEAHRESIALLRTKGYSWREIAAFLNKRGVVTDHTAVYRLIQGRSAMTTVAASRPYERVRSLVESIGGEMTWLAGGGPGGVWELSLHGRSMRVEARDNQVNDLDRLYVAKVENPRTWADYDSPGELLPDAFWRLVGLFQRQQRDDLA